MFANFGLFVVVALIGWGLDKRAFEKRVLHNYMKQKTQNPDQPISDVIGYEEDMV